jgi:hypothetical protein
MSDITHFFQCSAIRKIPSTFAAFFTPMKYIIIILAFVIVPSVLAAQQYSRNESEFDSLYAVRILQEEIDGVYIPLDLSDAFAELQRLSSPSDLQKFRQTTEEIARHKFHFGLGRWMIVNWGFYEGSRLSHYLKTAGLQHPDDMAQVILVCFHRYLNGAPLRFEEEVTFYQALREKERLTQESKKEVISEEKRVKKE